MNLRVEIQKTSTYEITTPVYVGPLDLLLKLIQSAELDITKLALAKVTDQFLEHLKNLRERDPEEVSLFLVMAAKLLQIKSEALLPKSPLQEIGEEDPGDELVRHLLEYKRFSELANFLSDRESKGLRGFVRLAAPTQVRTKVDMDGLVLGDLLNLARDVFSRSDDSTDIDTVVKPSRVTIREKITKIINSLRIRGRTSFFSILEKNDTRIDIIMTFLALLELVKQRFIEARQESLFGEITLESTDTWDKNWNGEIETKEKSFL